MEDGSRERQQPLLRSINNVHRSFVKFVNRTLHNVVLYWIDYQGQAVSYGALSPGDCLDIDTFVTHPWIFVDQETRDRRHHHGDPRNLISHRSSNARCRKSKRIGNGGGRLHLEEGIRLKQKGMEWGSIFLPGQGRKNF